MKKRRKISCIASLRQSYLKNHLLTTMSNFLKGALAKVQDKATHLIYGIEKKSSKMTFCSTVDKDMAGNERSMDEFKGNVLLVVNVACK
jgi:hypothetical protein